MRAGIAALEGRPADALALYRQALRDWRELGCVWDLALCGLDMTLLLDPSQPEVRAAADSAREIPVRLGARPFVERLDEALAKSTPTSAKPARGEPPVQAPSGVEAGASSA
jgi:hypothetical protein